MCPVFLCGYGGGTKMLSYPKSSHPIPSLPLQGGGGGGDRTEKEWRAYTVVNSRNARRASSLRSACVSLFWIESPIWSAR